MSVTYAGAKGRFDSGKDLPSTVESEALPVLSDEEMEIIADRVRLVQKHMPDAWEFMKALKREGMIAGMRSIASVTVFDEVT